MYRFLLTGKWIAGFIICVLASLLCLYLGTWQWDRKEALDHKNSLITTNYHAAPLSLDQRPDLFSDFDPDTQWTPVAMEGHYLRDHQLLVRNRPYEGLNGYDVVVPFESNNGAVVLIDRGWIPAGELDASQPGVDIPAPSAGEVKVEARIHPGEGSNGKGAPEGQVASLNLPEIKDETGVDIGTGAYGLLAEEVPAPAVAPAKAVEPELDTGPNLSYSVQWAVFALMCYFAYFWLARQKVRNDELDAQVVAELEAYYARFYDEEGNYIGEEDEAVVQRKMEMVDDMPSHMKSIVRPRYSKKRARPSDEEEEDAIVDRMP